MDEHDLIAFVHGMRLQRNAQQVTQKALTEALRGHGVKLNNSDLSKIETMTGHYLKVDNPAFRRAVVLSLGVAESVMIATGHVVIYEQGCRVCTVYGYGKISCGVHDPKAQKLVQQDHLANQ